jgi:hypothetical protein
MEMNGGSMRVVEGCGATSKSKYKSLRHQQKKSAPCRIASARHHAAMMVVVVSMAVQRHA